jgi:hypothetical protein
LVEKLQCTIRGILNNGFIPSLKTKGTPAKLDIKIKKDDRLLGHEKYGLVYKKEALLGNGCGITDHTTVDFNLEDK